MEIKVIICSQVYLYAEGLWLLLERDNDLRVLGVACNEQEVKKLLSYEPDVIVSDKAMCSLVLKHQPSGEDKRTLLINDNTALNSESLKSMIMAGLGGILPKSANGKLLQKAVLKLHEGELWIDRQTMGEVFRSTGEENGQIHLTKKETEVLNYVCGGLTNKEIAKKLIISEQTVKSHCNHLFKKFGVTSRLKLALCAPKHFPGSLSGLQ